MTAFELSQKIQEKRGVFSNYKILFDLCVDITNNGINEMIYLCHNGKRLGINKIAMFCNQLNSDEQKEMVAFIATKPKAREIDLKFQEIELRR